MTKIITYDPNADIEERCELYVARSRITGLYLYGGLGWFRANHERFKTAVASCEDIIAEFQAFDKAHCPWTPNINKADIWDRYWIVQFQDYVSVTWGKIKLSSRPVK